MPPAGYPDAAPTPGFRLLVNDGPAVLDAALCDMNAEVARVLVDRPLAAGLRVALLGRGASADGSCALAARVTHAAPWADRGWLVRCLFLRKLDRDELESLLA